MKLHRVASRGLCSSTLWADAAAAAAGACRAGEAAGAAAGTAARPRGRALLAPGRRSGTLRFNGIVQHELEPKVSLQTASVSHEDPLRPRSRFLQPAPAAALLA